MRNAARFSKKPRGLPSLTPDDNGPVFVQETVRDPDRPFEIYPESVSRLFAAA